MVQRTPEEEILLMSAGAYHASAAGTKPSSRSRGFNVLIDAFHNEINVTQTNKALPPGGFFKSNGATSPMSQTRTSSFLNPDQLFSGAGSPYILSQDGEMRPKIKLGGATLEGSGEDGEEIL